MQITREGNEIVVRMPATQSMRDYEGKKVGSMDSIIGVIEPEDKYAYKLGFAYVIDMTYAGKADQYTDIFLEYHGEADDFKELCKDLELDVLEYEACDKCHKAILGSCTFEKEGLVCDRCTIY